MKRMRILAPICYLFLIIGCATNSDQNKYQFHISFSTSLSNEVKNGRLLLMLSQNDASEPRFQINSGLNTQLIFGVDVDKLKPDEEIRIDASIFGFPLATLNDVPEGTYFVQALLNQYETFHLSSGHSVLLPPEKGEGQQWNRKPGNYYNKTLKN